MNPNFRSGNNIAAKVPPHEYAATVAFYRDVLELNKTTDYESDVEPSVRFEFGDKALWIDCVESASQAELWLEIVTDDIDAASEHFQQHGLVRRDEIEPLPEGFQAFWLSSPSNIIHLVSAEAP